MTLTLTRRAALTGATALATTAALPAMAVATAPAASDDAALLALCQRFHDLDAAQQAAGDAWHEAFLLEQRRPGFETWTYKELSRINHRAVFGADVQAKRQARELMVSMTYLTDSGMVNSFSPESLAAEARAKPHDDRRHALLAEMHAVEKEIAATPATTTPGVLAKLRVVARFSGYNHDQAMIEALIADLEAMAAGEGRLA